MKTIIACLLVLCLSTAAHAALIVEPTGLGPRENLKSDSQGPATTMQKPGPNNNAGNKLQSAVNDNIGKTSGMQRGRGNGGPSNSNASSSMNAGHGNRNNNASSAPRGRQSMRGGR